MAKKELVENIVKLYSKLGGNMNDVLGSRSNVTFLGTGKNPEPFVDLDINMEAVGVLGKSKILQELKSPMGYLTADKLNDIQATKLYKNMLKLEDFYYPKAAPANITDMATGTRNLDQEGLGALRAKGDYMTDEGVMASETILPMRRGTQLTDDLPPPGSRGGPDDIAAPIQSAEETFRKLEAQGQGDLAKQLQKAMMEGPLSKAGNKGDIPAKRASAREFLIETLKVGDDYPSTTLNDVISAEDAKYIFEGGGGIGGDPIALVNKYFGPRIAEALPAGATGEDITVFAKRVLENVEDAKGLRPDEPGFDRMTAKFIDEMAEGGRAGYNRGRLVGKAFGLMKKAKAIEKSVDAGEKMGYGALREYGLEAEDITRLFKEIAMDKTMVGPEKTAYFKMLNQVLKNPDDFPDGIIEIKKRLGLDFADGGRAGFRYGGDTMGGPNDKSIGGEGPDRTKVSDVQNLNHQYFTSAAQDYNKNVNNQVSGDGSTIGITTVETPQSKNINTLTKTGLLNDDDDEDNLKNLAMGITNMDKVLANQQKKGQADIFSELGLKYADGGRAGFKLGKSVFQGIANMFKTRGDEILDTSKQAGIFKDQEKTFRTGPITMDFLEKVDPAITKKFIRTRDTSGPGSYGMYDTIAEMPQGLQAAEFIKNVRTPGGTVNYELAEMYIGEGVKLTGKESMDELLQMFLNALKSYKSPFAKGGLAKILEV